MKHVCPKCGYSVNWRYDPYHDDGPKYYLNPENKHAILCLKCIYAFLSKNVPHMISERSIDYPLSDKENE